MFHGTTKRTIIQTRVVSAESRYGQSVLHNSNICIVHCAKLNRYLHKRAISNLKTALKYPLTKDDSQAIRNNLRTLILFYKDYYGKYEWWFDQMVERDNNLTPNLDWTTDKSIKKSNSKTASRPMGLLKHLFNEHLLWPLRDLHNCPCNWHGPRRT
jgi:hypothetical protein